MSNSHVSMQIADIQQKPIVQEGTLIMDQGSPFVKQVQKHQSHLLQALIFQIAKDVLKLPVREI